MRRYSRLATTEERKNIKRAYYYIVLTVITILLLIFVGLPAVVKFAGFVGNIGKPNESVEINDTTPPAPPQFNDIPEFTNEETLNITGKSENGATVSINANGDTSEVLANSSGEFNFTFHLERGENTISAKAKDTSNNESTQTKTYTIYFDNEEPELEVTTPSDGSTFYGSGQRQLSIKGTVNESVDLTINGRIAVVNEDDNSFSFTTTLNEGENKFEVIAKDPSGNESSSTLTVNFSL